MSFSAEINDFVNGFKAGAAVGGDIQDRKMAREKFEFEKAFKQGAADRANRALDIREKGIGARAAAKAAAASDKAAKAAAKEGEKAHKAEVKDFNELTRSTGGKSSTSSTAFPDEYEATGEEEIGDEYDSGAIESEETEVGAIPVGSEEVQRFAAAGGMMEADEEEQEAAEGKGDSEVVEAIPTASAKTDSEAPAAPAEPTSGEGKADIDPVYKEAATVTKAVMDEWNAEAGEKEEAVATKPQKSQDRIADLPPASVEEMKAMWAKVDPNGELDTQQKGAQTLVKAYKFFMSKGDAVKAKKIAGQIIKFNQMASMTQGQLALQALRAGDLQSASKLVSDAATQNVPDGVHVSAEPTPNGTVLYKIDRAGYAQEQGELGAQEMWKLASGVADGKLFIQRMAALAGEADPTSPSSEPAIGDPVPKKGAGKKRSYKGDVASAAMARKQYDALKKRYDDAVSMDGEDAESALALKSELDTAYDAYDKAFAQAKQGASKTGRDEKVFDADFNRALRQTVIPPGGKKEEQSDEKTDGEAPEQAIDPSAAPTQPTGPQRTTPPPVMKTKEVGGKTYVMIGGQWYEQGAE